MYMEQARCGYLCGGVYGVNSHAFYNDRHHFLNI